MYTRAVQVVQRHITHNTHYCTRSIVVTIMIYNTRTAAVIIAVKKTTKMSNVSGIRSETRDVFYASTVGFIK